MEDQLIPTIHKVMPLAIKTDDIIININPTD